MAQTAYIRSLLYPDKVAFNLPLDLPKPTNLNQGWSVNGNYWTTTDTLGHHMLNIEGHLASKLELDTDQPHYVGFNIEYGYMVASETFWTGYEPPIGESQTEDHASFYSHMVLEDEFSFIRKRVKNTDMSYKKEPCNFEELLNHKSKKTGFKDKETKCTKTWHEKKKPSIKGNKMLWGGHR